MSQHVMPFATYRPIAWAEARDDDTNPTAVILHLTASEATSQHGFFSNPANRACSNTHVDRSGRIEQYIRGDRLSAADSYGSSRAFSIETQGADANGLWTPEQCESIAQIIAWAHRTYAIPLRLMTSSATGQHGIGWHRLGVNGNFPPMPNILAGRLQRGGGEVWSGSFGKLCPGDNRIKQIPAILDRALAIVGGAPTPTEDDMPTVQEIADAVWGHEFQAAQSVGGRIPAETAGVRVMEMRKDTDRTERLATETTLLTRRVESLTTEVTLASRALVTLAQSKGVDSDAIVAEVRAALENLTIEITTKEN